MRALLFSALLVAACNKDPDDTADTDPVVEGDPIIVYITTDTLGLKAAMEASWCDRLTTVAGQYGLDVACLEGAVPPSSWTGPSHTRMLFPQNMALADAWRKQPSCGVDSFLGTIAAGTDAFYTFGADNPVLGPNSVTPCDDGSIPYYMGTDTAYGEIVGSEQLAEIAEEDRSVHHAITDLLAATETGDSAVAFLNIYEVGGHFPRCYFDPYTEGCEGLWQIGVDIGLTAADADRSLKWLDKTFQAELISYISYNLVTQEAVMRPLFWDSMADSIAYNQEIMFDQRLERLFGGLEDQGRLDDLTLVITSDHGENPCVLSPWAEGLNCMHGDLPTEWTAIVPAFVIPAAHAATWQAQGLVGADGAPWSATNLSYALVQHVGLPIPATWPAPTPVGTATTWACYEDLDANPITGGIRIVGDVSVRCVDGVCDGFDWQLPEDLNHAPAQLGYIPAEVADYAGEPNWFQQACASQ
jgi:hypothetical protein